MKFFKRLFNVWEYGTFTSWGGFPVPARRRARTGEIQLEYFNAADMGWCHGKEWQDMPPTRAGAFVSYDRTVGVVCFP